MSQSGKGPSGLAKNKSPRMLSETDVNPVMVPEICRDGKTFYVCEVCGFLYKEKLWAERCQEYCAKHNACSMDITRHSVQEEAKPKKRPKALVLLSGGLDSMLAAKLIVDQGVDVEAVHFSTPFSKHDDKLIHRFCEELGVGLHRVFLGQEYLDMLVSPKHGYGSQMNPCVDCRILTFTKAKRLAEEVGADFLVTGEVLDERPFSQRRDLMLLIEKEAGLEGKILRPLSAKVLAESEPEKEGIVNREEFFGFRGRRRVPQMELARKLGIRKYPNPSGGCLLTDPRFAERLKEHLNHEGSLSLLDAELLKTGRHFRVNGAKVIVGRNKDENGKLQSIAEKHSLALIEVIGYMGPLTVLAGEADPETVKTAAAITARYSDAEEGINVKVRYRTGEDEEVLETKPITDQELGSFTV